MSPVKRRLLIALFGVFCVSGQGFANHWNVFLDEPAIHAKILQGLRYRIDSYKGDKKSTMEFLAAIDCLTHSCLDSVFKVMSPEDAAELFKELHLDFPIEEIRAFSHGRGYDRFTEEDKFHRQPKNLTEEDPKKAIEHAELHKIESGAAYFKEATFSLLSQTKDGSTVLFLGRSPALLSIYFKEYIKRHGIDRHVVDIDFSGKANLAPEDKLAQDSNPGEIVIDRLLKSWVSSNRFKHYSTYLDRKLPWNSNAPIYIVDKADSGNGLFSFMYLLDRYFLARKNAGRSHPSDFMLFEMGHLPANPEIHDSGRRGNFADLYTQWQKAHSPNVSPTNRLEFKWEANSLFNSKILESFKGPRRRNVLFHFPSFVESLGSYEDWQSAGDAVYYPPYLWDRLIPEPAKPGPVKTEIIKTLFKMIE